LPPELPNGQVTGLRARGGDTIDITWENGEITHATLHTHHAHTVAVRTSVPMTVTAPDDDHVVAARRTDPTTVTFDATAGTSYRLTRP
ncbi:glycoside hydrolase family 95-like protein, partial [Streptomyces sp. B6B3]|uniref:glycoside hydrolase family 95-like protein n=1 Tax=Streptomyces sp. B6B3 TaxID=3153570 RepID=UPI00325C71BA